MPRPFLRAVPALAALMLGLVALPGLPAAASAPRPDLKVSRVTPGTADVLAGDTVRVASVVQNAGMAAAGRSKATLYLSTDSKLGRTDKALTTVAVRRLAPGARAALDIGIRIPSATPAGTRRVLVCADSKQAVKESKEGNNCASSGPLTVRAPDSGTLIDRAVESGALDAETGLVYKVFALTGDPRLPAKYAGDDSQALGSPLSEAVDEWAGLSPATQELLTPFLIPPFLEGSHWTPETAPARTQRAVETGGSPGCVGALRSIGKDWSSVASDNGHVRVWWEAENDATDRRKAELILDAVDTKIWPAIKALMGREPMLDGGGACSGPDEAIDLSLVDVDTDTTIGSAFGSCGSSTHILLKRSRPNPLPWVAHELFHAVQFSYDVADSCSSYAWLREATAQWFMDYVSSPVYGIGITPDNAEWLYGAPELYLDNPEVSLDSTNPKHHEYGSYLFFLFLARFDTPNLIPAVWNGVGTMSSVDATAAPLGGNLDAAWREFVKDNWNRGSVDAYRTWDGLTAQVADPDEFALRKGSEINTIEVDHLASKYLTFVPTKDVTLLKLDIETPDLAGLGVQAIIEYADGTTKVEDWTGDDHAELCLTDPKVEKVTLVFSNSSPDPAGKISLPVTVTGKAGLCCSAQPPSPRTRGSATPTAAGTTAGTCPSATGTITWTEVEQYDSYRSTLTITIDVRMQHSDEGNWWDDAGSTYTADYRETQSGYDGDCTYTGSFTGSGSGAVRVDAGALVEEGDLSPVTGDPATGREWLLGTGHQFHAEVTGGRSYSCPNGPVYVPDDYTLDREIWMADGCPGDPFIWFKGAADARTFSYSCQQAGDSTTRTTTADISIG